MDGQIYAYRAESSAQRAYIEQRVAQFSAQRREQQRRSGQDQETRSSDAHYSEQLRLSRGSLRDHQHGSFHLSHSSLGTQAVSCSNEVLQYPSAKMHPRTADEHNRDLLSNPFKLHHGRRYLRNVPYPLPCDLAELQRQNLRTLLLTNVFGGPVCANRWDDDAPKKVLDVGCGSGYWSAIAHDYFARRGYPNVQFVGMDLAPLAPDHSKHGVHWTFVQHDVRSLPYPWDDGEFDLVMCKDLSMIVPLGTQSERFLDEGIRITKDGGVFEVWDSDHVVRSLLPDIPPPPSKRPKEQAIAEETATFPLAPGHAFLPTPNRYLQDSSAWISEALDRRELHPTPCVRIAEMLLQEPKLTDVSQRRVAIPFGELLWEKEAAMSKCPTHGHKSPLAIGPVVGSGCSTTALTPDQAAIRHTALNTVVQMIESMEPLLKEVSKKNAEEWSNWWASMLANLLDPSKAGLTGECLEVGAWWATKVPDCDQQ